MIYTQIKTSFKCITFWAILLTTSFAISMIMIPWFPLKRYYPRAYRQLARIAEQSFGSLVIILSYFYASPTLVLTGDHQWLSPAQRCVVMANHQIYPDWWYIWIFAWLKGTHGDLKIILMDYLKYIPILGQGMWFLEFVFMKQKWAIDRITMKKHLESVKKTKLPFWLLIFPEGTLNTPNNIEKSRKYALKMGLTEEPKHTLLPKSTGLLYSLSALRPEVHTLVDITIGYAGISAEQVPFDAYLVENVFFRNQKPPAIHMHVRTFNVNKIPGFNSGSVVDIEDLNVKKEFDVWLRARFMEKDALLKTFYESGKFDVDCLVNDRRYELEAGLEVGYVSGHERNSKKKIRVEVADVGPELKDWIMIGFMWYSLVYMTFPAYYWLVCRFISIFV